MATLFSQFTVLAAFGRSPRVEWSGVEWSGTLVPKPAVLASLACEGFMYETRYFVGNYLNFILVTC